MFKFIAILALATVGAVFAIGPMERAAIYPFDAAHVTPKAAGVAMQEQVFANDSQDLVVWVAAPKPGKPVVIYFNGNAGNLANRAGRFSRFIAHGYGVVSMAYRGSSGSTGTPGEDAITRDARALYGRIGEMLPGVNAPIVLYGESLGTGVVIAVLDGDAARKNPPAAVILEAPYTSVRDVARVAYPPLGPLVGQMQNEWDSLGRANRLRAPLLVLHGTKDPLIPFAQGQQIFAAAPTKHKQLLAIKDGGHNDLWRSNTLPKIWRFIDTYADKIP